jgi:hypothetical protein
MTEEKVIEKEKENKLNDNILRIIIADYKSSLLLYGKNKFKYKNE